MKTQATILIALMLLLTGGLQAQRKNKAEQSAKIEQQFKDLQTLMNSNRFQVTIDRVYPMNGADLTRFNPTGTITVTDSTAKGKLPYFGRAYTLSYGEGGGIEFDNTIKGLQVKTIEKKKKNSVFYQFNVDGKNDVYRITIEAFPGGTCSVGINSNNRRNISYSGKIENLPETANPTDKK